MKNFCPLPFTHAHIDTAGSVKPCCINSLKLGQVNKEEFGVLMQSEKIQKLRQAFLDGQQPSSCSSCWKKEADGSESERQKRLEASPIFPVKEKLSSQYFELQSLDIRLSNLCNLKCRTCWHGASSSWYTDALALGQKPKKAHIKWDNPQHFFESIQFGKTPNPEVYFAGGEPGIEPQHGAILDLLYTQSKGEIKLRYTTNCTKFSPSLPAFCEAVSRFKQVDLEISLDLIGKGAEWLRPGEKWAKIEANLEGLKKYPNLHLTWHPTVSILNVRWLGYMHRYLVKKGWFTLDQLWLNILERPDYFKIGPIQARHQAIIIANLEFHLGWLVKNGASEKTKTQFLQLQKLVAKCSNEKSTSLWKNLGTLDQIRREKSSDFLPLEI